MWAEISTAAFTELVFGGSLSTDASNYSTGAILSQNDHPVNYAPRTLNQAERNYSTIEKELLAIVWTTKYFQLHLYGRKFTIYTDHKLAVFLKKTNSRLVR